MKVTDTHVYFWKGFLSQWTVDPFEEYGVKFPTCEHFMMYRKALLFKDYDVAKKVLETDAQHEVKALGRQVKNFDPVVWDRCKEEIVFRGNYLRFSQNAESYRKLMKYTTQKFVEASPFDNIWGVGLEENDPRILDEANWTGQNLLGNVLTELRNQFLKEY